MAQWVLHLSSSRGKFIVATSNRISPFHCVAPFFFSCLERVDNLSNANEIFFQYFFFFSVAHLYVHPRHLHVSFQVHTHSFEHNENWAHKIILIVLFATENKTTNKMCANWFEESERMHCMNIKCFRVIQRSLTFIKMNNFDAMAKTRIEPHKRTKKKKKKQKLWWTCVKCDEITQEKLKKIVHIDDFYWKKKKNKIKQKCHCDFEISDGVERNDLPQNEIDSTV